MFSSIAYETNIYYPWLWSQKSSFASTTTEEQQTNLIFIVGIIKTAFLKTVVNDLSQEGERVKKTSVGFPPPLNARILTPVGFRIQASAALHKLGAAYSLLLSVLWENELPYPKQAPFSSFIANP